MAEPTSDSDSQLKTLLHALQSSVGCCAQHSPFVDAPKKKKKMRIHSIKNSVFCGFSCLPFLILLRLRLGAFYSSFSTSAACLRWMEPPCGVPWKMKKCEGKRGIARKSKYDIKSWTMWQSEGGFCRPQQTTNCIRLAGLQFLSCLLIYVPTPPRVLHSLVCLAAGSQVRLNIELS